jgi:hypothetical protein
MVCEEQLNCFYFFYFSQTNANMSTMHSKSDRMVIATRRLFDLIWFHAMICICILLVQVRLHLVSPIVSVFLIHINLICLSERSWKVQAKTMQIWHPVVQLIFCSSRMVQGAVVILQAVLWLRVALLCAEGMVN